MENTKTQALREQISKLVDEYAAIALAPQPFLPGLTLVPPSGKVVGAEELKNMVEASLDGWLTTGRFNAEFEKKLAAFIGVKHLLTVNSGSSANLVAFSTLTSPKLGERAIQKGDEVIGVAAGDGVRAKPGNHHLGLGRHIKALAMNAARLKHAHVVVRHPPHVAVGITRQQHVTGLGEFGRVRAMADIGNDRRWDHLGALVCAVATHQFAKAGQIAQAGVQAATTKCHADGIHRQAGVLFTAKA